jgi:hypothetical protein
MAKKDSKLNKRGFVVQLSIFDRKLEQYIIKIEKMTMDDFEKLDEELKHVIKKFK